MEPSCCWHDMLTTFTCFLNFMFAKCSRVSWLMFVLLLLRYLLLSQLLHARTSTHSLPKYLRQFSSQSLLKSEHINTYCAEFYQPKVLLFSSFFLPKKYTNNYFTFNFMVIETTQNNNKSFGSTVAVHQL